MAYTRGKTVLIEVEFKRKAAFGSLAYFDPTVPKITVTDPVGTVKVDAADLTKSETGKYYYICQTAASWIPGVYATIATGTDGSYAEREVNAAAFELI